MPWFRLSSCASRSAPMICAAAVDSAAAPVTIASSANRALRTRATPSTPEIVCSYTLIGSGSAAPVVCSGREHQDRFRPERLEGPQMRFDPRACRRDHREADPILGRADGPCPAEHRLGRVPRGQPVDLRADDAVQEFGGALGQFERAEQEMAGRRTSSMSRPRTAAATSSGRDPSPSRRNGSEGETTPGDRSEKYPSSASISCNGADIPEPRDRRDDRARHHDRSRRRSRR